MKRYIALAAIFVAPLATRAEPPAPEISNSSEEFLTATVIAKTRIQQISRALTDLKVEEVGLEAGSKDDSKLKTVIAQEAELERELLRVAIWALEDEDRRLSDKYLPEYPKRRMVRAEIDARKAELAARG